MSDAAFALTIALVVFAFGAIGLRLQRVLPERFTTDARKDLIGSMASLFSLLSALVLGLLIWTAYGVYSGQNVAIQTLAAKLIQLLALADYGPEADAGRAQMRQDLARTLQSAWGEAHDDEAFMAENFSAAIDSMRHKAAVLQALTPRNDREKQALASAAQAMDSVVQSRLQLALGLSNPVSYRLVYVVVSWVAVLFCGYGLMSRDNAMSIIVFGFGALATASAVYVILDLSSPYAGLFRTSPAPLERALAQMSRGEGMVGSAR